MLKIDLKFGVDNKNLEFTINQKELIEQSGNFLIQILNSESFEKQIKNYKWKGNERFNHTKDSRTAIYTKLLSGNDNFIDEFIDDQNQLDDKDLDIWVFPYKTKTDIVGRTFGYTYRTWINLNNLNYKIKKYENYPTLLYALISQNLIHEYCHNLGYKHKGNKRNKHNNIYSVPYGVGDIIKNEAERSYFIGIEPAILKDFNYEYYDCHEESDI